MANWTDIDTNNLLPGQPFTSPIALALEENPRAIADGAAGAPKISRKYLTGTDISGGPTSSVTFSDLQEWNGLTVIGINPALDTDISFSNDGSNFVASTAIKGTTLFSIDFTSGSYIDVNASPTTGTISGIPANVSHVKFTETDSDTSSAIISVTVELTGGFASS